MDPKVARIMEKIKYEPSEGSKLPYFRGHTTQRGLGYNSDEEEPKIKKKGLKLRSCFVKASWYQGEPESIGINRIMVPDFEIFQDMLGQKPIVEGTTKKEKER